MRALVTGAAGFIGSHVVRSMLDTGTHVTAIVRPGSDPARLADVRDRIEVLSLDLKDGTALRRTLRRREFDVCLHLAWAPTRARSAVAEQCGAVVASIEVIQTVIEVACPRLLIAGSASEYAANGSQLTEDATLRAEDAYGAAKLGLHSFANEICAIAGVQLVWPRIFHCYGPIEDPARLVPSVIRSLLRGEPARTTKGELIRDYLHVEDVADALWLVARSSICAPVNIGSGTATTIAELVRLIGRLMGKEHLLRIGALPYRPNEPRAMVADVSRLRELGWVPRHDLEAGVRDSIAWWSVNPS